MSETLERDWELDRIADALEGAARGAGRAVFIEGPAGIGKTRLVQDARALAKARSFGRLQATGDELESAMPWSVVRQLVERSVSRYSGEVREAILAGPSGRALTALGEAPPDANAGDPAVARTLHALWWVAVDLSATRPLLITVDDAQWADPPSLRFLSYLSRRIEDLPVALVVGSRPPQERSGPLAELDVGHHGERIRPRPLSVTAVRELATRGDLAPAAAVAEAVHAAGGGNPFLCRLLLDELDARALPLEAPRTAGVVAGLGPSSVSRALLARLPQDASVLAGAAAVLGARSDPWLAAGLVGLDAARVPGALDTLIAGNVLEARQDELHFVHPVVREAVLAQLGPGERAALHATAARTLHAAGAPATRVAAHLAQAPPGTLPDASALLQRAAAGLLASDPAAAAGHLARALAEQPGEPELTARLGLALLRAGDAAAARPHLLEAAAAAGSPRLRAERLAAAASATQQLDGPAAAVAELRDVLETWSDGEELPAARLVLEARLATLCSVLPEERPRAAERLRAFGGLRGETAEERTVLSLLAQRGRYDVLPAAEVADLATRSLSDGAYFTDVVDGVDGLVSTISLTAADGFDEARREIVRAQARVRAVGSPLDFAMVSVATAWHALRRGALAEADAEADAALAATELELPGPVVTAVRSTATHCAALARIERGHTAAAAAAIAAHDTTAADGTRVIPATSLREARAMLALAEGEPARALTEARACGAEAIAARLDTPTLPWRVVAAHAALRLDDHAEARRLAAEHHALAVRWGAPSHLAHALRLLARVEPEDRIARLEEAARLLEDSPARLELAGVLVDLGEAYRVDNQRRAAHAPLRRGAELATACQATVLRKRALDGLGAIGDRPRELMASGEESLTASELRVARFALDGRTNRDIAQELFVTPKTVENHLGRVHMKLGITSRRQLAGALA